MEKKRILFIMESLGIGGAEKSLLTILNLIDYNKYDVDLFLFRHTGDFFSMIPKQVNVLNEDTNYKIFSDNRKLSPIKFLLRFDLKSFFYSIRWLIGVFYSKIKKEKLYIGWKNIEKLFKGIDKEYDTSIAFLERKTIYFNVDKVKSKNKVGFIHNDYSKYPYDDKLDRYYFKYYNKIPTVSEHCKDVLRELFPEYKEKFIVIKNMVSKKLINEMTVQPIENYSIDKSYVNIVSVGRLNYQKGFDEAVDICKKLIDENIPIKWYIVGEGEERQNIENKIKKYNMENSFFLVGADTNPYRWMRMCDIYVQPSRFEGYGITVAEAKVLNKPIIARDIPEFVELLKNDKGILAKTKEDFVTKIKTLVDNKKMRAELINKLKEEDIDMKEIDKLNEIM